MTFESSEPNQSPGHKISELGDRLHGYSGFDTPTVESGHRSPTRHGTDHRKALF